MGFQHLPHPMGQVHEIEPQVMTEVREEVEEEEEPQKENEYYNEEFEVKLALLISNS